MDFETYSRSKQADYAALAETVASISQAAIKAYPGPFRLQQVQHRAKNPESLKKKLEDRKLQSTAALETDVKDLAGCRLIFYTNSDVSRLLQTGIIQDNFDVDWERTKIHHPVPGRTDPDNLFISDNYVVKLKANRASLPEYARFADLSCEVQIQTTLNHAWSEMEHDILYKKPKLEGFGGKLFGAIEQRLQTIMRTHLATVFTRYKDGTATIIDSVMLPGIDYFTEKRDARWVNLAWYIPKETSPLAELTAAQTENVLRNLVCAPQIDTHAEWILAILADADPERVFRFFGDREGAIDW